MISSKRRTALVALASSAAMAVAAVAPAASQAQWHNYCVNGVCTTHSNYTIENVHACGPSDYMGASSSSPLADATAPQTDEEKAAAAEQAGLDQFDGVCAN